MVSFDDGVTWNKTYYECDKVLKKKLVQFEILYLCQMIYCPNNVSIVISSLISSNDAPGIIAGKGMEKLYIYI